MSKILDSNCSYLNDKIAMGVFKSIRWVEVVYFSKSKFIILFFMV